MADYTPLHSPGDQFSRVASATITGGQVVIVSGSGTVAPSTVAAPTVLGVAAFDAISGDSVTVITEGVQRLKATGTVTAGDKVEAATAGTVATHTLGSNDTNVIGLALTTATTGNLVEVMFV